MLSQRNRHGIAFTACPECQVPTGTKGLAQHRQAQHGVTPATRKNTKPKPLTTAQATDLRTAIADGAIPTTAIAFNSLLKAGYVTADGSVTDDGRNRLA